MTARKRVAVMGALIGCCGWGAPLAAQMVMPGMTISAPATASADAGPDRKAKTAATAGAQLAGAGSDSLRAAGRPRRLPPNDHVAPAAVSPGTTMASMPGAGMVMAGPGWLGMFLANELEWRGAPQGPQAAWDVEAWAGTPRQRLWLESEGRSSDRGGSQARTELLFDQAMSRFWDWRLGYRQDAGGGPARSWLAGGVQGLAPYWFELTAMAYVSPLGRVAVRVEARYDMLLTQRLILTPKFETAIYSRADPRRGLGGGLSDAELGLRLRYEVSRKFAPYLGVGWTQPFGATASWDRRRQQSARGLEWMLGVRLWF